MDKQIIALSGMPASGKDTVTSRLCQNFPEFVPFKKFRSVTTDMPLKDTYYNITVEEFEQKIKNGDFLQYHGRYGRYYGVAEQTLLQCFEQQLIPIIHIGRIANFYDLKNGVISCETRHSISIKLYHILLWETKEALTERITLRDKTKDEVGGRIEAMEQEFQDNISLITSGERPYTAVIRNINISGTCDMIRRVINGEEFNDGYDEFRRYLGQI